VIQLFVILYALQRCSRQHQKMLIKLFLINDSHFHIKMAYKGKITIMGKLKLFLNCTSGVTCSRSQFSVLFYCFTVCTLSSLELKLFQQWQSQEMSVADRCNFPHSEKHSTDLLHKNIPYFRDVSRSAHSPGLSVPNKLRGHLTCHIYHIWHYITENSATHIWIKLRTNA
jgi:hypothetical protein